ncbi:MAG: FHA domain-containing protein [Myxococcota bacterium]
MARLVYLDNMGHEQQVHIHQSNPEVTIGRNPSCIVHTPNATVSRFHCVVKQTHEGCEVIDQNSSSGTFLNSYKIQRQLLRHGDEICCGRFPLMFYEDHIQEIPWPDALWGGPTGWLLFKDDMGNERSLRMGAGSPRINIGRQNDCAIQTSDHSVSRVHAEVLFEGGQFEVVDLQSANGTRINNDAQRLNRQTLRSGDEIRLGQGRFIIHFYEEPGVPVVPNPGRSPYETVAPDLHENWSPAPSPPRTPEPSSTVHGMPQVSVESNNARVEELESTVSELRAENNSLRGELERANARSRDRSPSDAERELQQQQIVMDRLKQRVDEAEDQQRNLENERMELRTELRKKRDEAAEMGYKLSLLEREQLRDDAETSSLVNDNASLKAQVEQLRRDYEEADRRANLFEFELKELKEGQPAALQVNPQANERGPSGVFSRGDTRVLQATQNLNDVVSEFRNDLRNLKDYVEMIRTVYDAYRAIELQYLTSSERTRVEDAIQEVAPDMVFEDIQMTLEESLNNINNMKDRILELRDSVS